MYEKVVFLDIDGVIATEEALWQLYEQYYGIDLESAIEDSDARHFRLTDNDIRKESNLPLLQTSMKYWPFSQTAMKNMYELHQKTECQFVLSSSWRTGRSVEKINELFRLKGFYIAMIDTTEHYKRRDEEILHWVDTHKPTSYIVIDDEHFDLGGVQDILVQPKSYYGFQYKDLEKSLDLFSHS